MWRSLVARLTGGQKAAGSNPVIPTNLSSGPSAAFTLLPTGMRSLLPASQRSQPGTTNENILP